MVDVGIRWRKVLAKPATFKVQSCRKCSSLLSAFGHVSEAPQNSLTKRVTYNLTLPARGRGNL
jgi:hypothetical protein